MHPSTHSNCSPPPLQSFGESFCNRLSAESWCIPKKSVHTSFRSISSFIHVDGDKIFWSRLWKIYNWAVLDSYIKLIAVLDCSRCSENRMYLQGGFHTSEEHNSLCHHLLDNGEDHQCLLGSCNNYGPNFSDLNTAARHHLCPILSNAAQSKSYWPFHYSQPHCRLLSSNRSSFVGTDKYMEIALLNLAHSKSSCKI